MGALILDASVLIGLLDSADAHHQRAVDDVERADQAGRRLFAPASAFAEALVGFARAGRTREASDAVAAMGITVAPLTATMAEGAALLRLVTSSCGSPTLSCLPARTNSSESS